MWQALCCTLHHTPQTAACYTERRAEAHHVVLLQLVPLTPHLASGHRLQVDHELRGHARGLDVADGGPRDVDDLERLDAERHAAPALECGRPRGLVELGLQPLHGKTPDELALPRWAAASGRQGTR